MSDHPSAPLATLRASQDRALEREGIPMVLALIDMTATARELRAADPAEGVALAAALSSTWSDLAGTQRDDDLGVAHSVMCAVSFADFNAGMLP